MSLTLAMALLLAAPAAGRYFDVEATFVPPPKARADASIDVLFTPLDPDVAVNETPPVRIKLDPSQVVLVDRHQPASPRAGEDQSTPRYVDITKPIRFPVAFVPSVPSGTWDLGATVVYFFCSKREGWCRRGSAEVRFVVTVP
jgi:hypothetical protein